MRLAPGVTFLARGSGAAAMLDDDETTASPFSSAGEVGQVLGVPISHDEGNYYADPETLARLNAEDRVVFRYCTPQGEVTREANPNGSIDNIAGILSEGRNVLGMMPH